MSAGGAEYVLSSGRYQAVVTEIGGGLRLLRHGSRDLVRRYGPTEVRPRYAGVLLAPWPNRVVDGRYAFRGQTHQLPLTEPERSHALHGLALWDRFELRDRSPTSVTLVDRLVPRTGYPFEVEVKVRYYLGPDGLSTTVTAHNVGAGPAPWGTAGHPYLQAGTDHVDECRLSVPAGQVLDVTPDRLVPVGLVPVRRLGLDFREERAIGDTFIDHAYTSLQPGEDGLARVRLTAPCGEGVECSWDPDVLPWVQVHTADTPEAVTHRTGLAVEPMTCAPDAFNSGAGLVVLPPGGEHAASWTISAVEG
jgi:aldose 1-epimerase